MSDDSARMPLRDTDTIGLRVTRSVPIWSVLTALVVIVAQAVSLQLGQSRQGELIADANQKLLEQKGAISALAIKVELFSAALNDANLRTARIEYRLDDHDRRVNALERPMLETRIPRRP